MRRMQSMLVTGAAVAAAVVGTAAIASAATSSTTSPSTTPPSTSYGAQPGAPAAPPQGAPGQGNGQFNPARGGHMVNGKTEKLLTGDVAAKVRAAALAKAPGTVERVETNVDDSVPYEAHIVKSDGSHVIVEVNSDYSIASVKAGP